MKIDQDRGILRLSEEEEEKKKRGGKKESRKAGLQAKGRKRRQPLPAEQ